MFCFFFFGKLNWWWWHWPSRHHLLAVGKRIPVVVIIKGFIKCKMDRKRWRLPLFVNLFSHPPTNTSTSKKLCKWGGDEEYMGKDKASLSIWRVECHRATTTTTKCILQWLWLGYGDAWCWRRCGENSSAVIERIKEGLIEELLLPGRRGFRRILEDNGRSNSQDSFGTMHSAHTPLPPNYTRSHL